MIEYWCFANEIGTSFQSSDARITHDAQSIVLSNDCLVCLRKVHDQMLDKDGIWCVSHGQFQMYMLNHLLSNVVSYGCNAHHQLLDNDAIWYVHTINFKCINLVMSLWIWKYMRWANQHIVETSFAMYTMCIEILNSREVNHASKLSHWRRNSRWRIRF